MDTEFDVTIIGGGIIGLSIGYLLSKKKLNILILESNNIVGKVNSSRNTEVIHAGIYYKTGSLKQKLCSRGKEQLYEFCNKFNVKNKKIGKIFYARNSEDLNNLDRINALAIKNDIFLKEITKSKMNALEPNLISNQGLLSETSGIFDSYDFMEKLSLQINDNNGIISLNTSFVNAEMKNDYSWIIDIGDIDKSLISSKCVINAAGLNALSISNKIFGVNKIISSNPVKGSYLKYTSDSPIRHIVYPAISPGEIKERVDFTPNINGGLMFGPSIERTTSLNDFSVSNSLLKRFIPTIQSSIKNIDISKINFDQSGIRPRIIYDMNSNPDFYIEWEKNTTWLNLFGIESPGLTSSLAIAEYVLAKISEKNFL